MAANSLRGGASTPTKGANMLRWCPYALALSLLFSCQPQIISQSQPTSQPSASTVNRGMNGPLHSHEGANLSFQRLIRVVAQFEVSLCSRKDRNQQTHCLHELSHENHSLSLCPCQRYNTSPNQYRFGSRLSTGSRRIRHRVR